MNFKEKRPYRKQLSAPGVVFINGQKQAVIIKNISITGVLAELQNYTNQDDVLVALSQSTSLDIQIPELQLTGEAEIIRVEYKNDQIALGLKFKQLQLNSDTLTQKRKFHRKKLIIPGEILLHGNYQGFVAVNVSRDGMMIHLAKPIEISTGTTAKFRFKQLGVEGEFKVMWANTNPRICTWLGGKYFGMKKASEKLEALAKIKQTGPVRVGLP